MQTHDNFPKLWNLLLEARLRRTGLLTKEPHFITEYIIIGGYKSDIGAEVKVECTGLSFYVNEFAKFGQPPNFFLPVDTPRSKANLDRKEVDAFFSLEKLPKEIKKILGGNVYSLTWW